MYSLIVAEYGLRSIFIGGGTPSLLDESLITNIMAFIRRYFHVEKNAEVTIEANPGTLRHQKLNGYKAAGINRISIGLQSCDDDMLKKLGRIHNFDQFVASYNAARRAGFQNINIDIMSGLPGQTIHTYVDTLTRVIEFAPEHISDKVLSRMGKPSRAVYDSFIKRYKRINDKTGKEQFVVPYLMSSHPGSTMKEAIELAEYVRDLGYMPEQVQDISPTPSTLSTCMYYTGYDPRTMEKVYTPVSHHEKEMQRALIQYKKPENYDLVKEALLANNRNDLIGFGPKCLIPPRKIRSRSNEKSRKR